MKISRVVALVLGSAVSFACAKSAEVADSFPGAAWENSLGMRFVSVPGTGVRFSIWETRVRDFAAFMDASGHVSTGDVYSLDPADQQWKVHPTNTWQSPGFPQSPEHPVVNTSWNDAVAFCRWLTARERAAGVVSSAQEYRLPTDAEWSVAAGPAKYPWGEQWPPPARAGNYWGAEHADSKRAVIADYGDGELFVAPVGSFAPNAFGLFDLSGNVWEWCSDHYRKEMNADDIRQESPGLDNDAGGTAYRVMRGGGWVDGLPRYLRTDFRSYGRPVNRYCTGFRIVLAPIATQAANEPSVSREYATNCGPVSLTFQGEKVTGRYRISVKPNPDEGTITGVLKDGLLEGTWEEAHSRGRIVIGFSADRSRLHVLYNVEHEKTGWFGDWWGVETSQLSTLDENSRRTLRSDWH